MIVELTPRGRRAPPTSFDATAWPSVSSPTAWRMDSESEIEQQACKFEHILSPEATDKICSFLGHPRTCPHGAPIPPGPCCQTKVVVETAMGSERSGVKAGR